jgi:hypothetical protein
MRPSRICSSYRACFHFEGRLLVGETRRQRLSTISAMKNERNVHTHDRQLPRLSTCTRSSLVQHGSGGQVLKRNSMESVNMLQSLSIQPSSHCFAAMSRSLTTSEFDVKSTHKNGNCRGGRFFGSDSTSSSKPSPIGQQVNTKSKKTVPKEYLAGIKAEVDEMEYSPPNTPQQDLTFPRAKKTQDDFADYLKGAEIMLDGEGGLVMKSISLAQNTSSRENVTSSSSSSLTSNRSLEQSASVSVSSISDDDDDVNKHSERKAQTDASSSTSVSPATIYQYKFSSSDATLSDPQRHLDRRRAMEQKLQERQAESRASTMKNVQRALAGNFIIAAAKLAAAVSSGSSAMLSEFVHSVVDCGNQALLLVGLNSSKYAPDRSHPYGYGKAIYFWALVSLHFFILLLLFFITRISHYSLNIGQCVGYFLLGCRGQYDPCAWRTVES